METAFLHLHLVDARRRRAVVRRAVAEGFRTVDRAGSAWLGWRGSEPRPVTRRGNLLRLGAWYADGPGVEPRSLEDLIATGWGRYAALRRDPDGRVIEALRDPSGSLEVACWVSGDAQIVASGTPDWLWSLLPAAIRIDWPGVGGLVDDPLALLARPPLQGIEVLDAGEALDLTSSDRRLLWRPVEIARGRGRRSPAHLVGLVYRCIAALSPDEATEAVEVSGGLDSAIVAAALVGVGRSPVALNLWHDAPGADERPYARSVADHLGLTLATQKREPAPPDAEDLLALAGDLRPALGRADGGFDRTLAGLLRTHGVARQFTGKGGDAVFLQNWSADVLADHLRRWGPLGRLTPLSYRLARLSRRSIRSLVREARGLDASPAEPPRTLASRAARPAPTHPWLEGAEALPPGKRRQLRALVSNLAYVTASRRADATEVIHPLMSQPIVEWALMTPTPVLMDGSRDRSFARRAFAFHLPAAVIDRRSKGEHGAVQGLELARALPALRDHLLDGELVRRGLIDPTRLASLLDRDQLAWRGGAALLVRAALVESWARRWAERERHATSRRPDPGSR